MFSWILQLQADSLILWMGIGGLVLIVVGAFLWRAHRKAFVSLGALGFLSAYGLYLFIQVGHPEVFAQLPRTLGPLSQEKHTFIEGCWSAATGCEQGDATQCSLYQASSCPQFPGGQQGSKFLEALLMSEEQWLSDCVTIALRCTENDADSCTLYETAHCDLFETQ